MPYTGEFEVFENIIQDISLLENEDYDTSIFEIGDGMAVSVKKD